MADSSVIKSVTDVFLKYRIHIIKALTQNLRDADKDQPGKLIQSIDVNIEVNGLAISFALSMEDYWKFVDEGVQGTDSGAITSQYKFKKGGKRIPLDAIKKFIGARGISPSHNIKRGKQLSTLKNKKIKKVVNKINKQKDLDSAAWAIGSVIKKRGVKPTYFFSDVINEELYTNIRKDIAEALGKDIEIDFKTFN